MKYTARDWMFYWCVAGGIAVFGYMALVIQDRNFFAMAMVLSLVHGTNGVLVWHLTRPSK